MYPGVAQRIAARLQEREANRWVRPKKSITVDFVGLGWQLVDVPTCRSGNAGCVGHRK